MCTFCCRYRHHLAARCQKASLVCHGLYLYGGCGQDHEGEGKVQVTLHAEGGGGRRGGRRLDWVEEWVNVLRECWCGLLYTLYTPTLGMGGRRVKTHLYALITGVGGEQEEEEEEDNWLL